MAHARLSSLLVIALLQLSQTEISSTLPESWYAANVINDGAYSPKPISEIFTTQPTFSSTNPIIVLSSSSTPDPILSTSVPPSNSVSTSTSSTTFSTTPKPINEVSVVPLPTQQPVQPQSFESGSQSSTVTTIVLEQSQPQPPQPPQPQFPQLSLFQRPPAPPSPPPILSTPQQIQVQTAPQGTPPPSQIANQPPNYFLLYQQAPQTVQNYPPGPPIISLPPLDTTSSQAPPITSTLSTVPTVVSTTSLPTVTSTLPPRITSTSLPARSTSTPAPCANSVTSMTPQANLPSFKIRLVAPSGSVTNVRINPNPTTTTTRRPTTTRTRRKNRNTYDGCVSSCTGQKIPICASPLGASPIDPNTLKGFPSVCHMACHNSYRKNLYEKVMDGKCSRLRNRIKPLNSNSKLKKEDLNKATYTIVQGGPGVVEFSPLV